MASLPVSASRATPAHHDMGVGDRTSQMIAGCLAFAVVFLNAADFRGGTGEEFTVHWQIYLRLLVCAACGCTALLLLHRSLAPFLTFPGMMMTGLIAWQGVSCIFSVNRNYSLVAFVCLGAIVMITPALMSLLGGLRFLMVIGLGLVVYLVGSWVAYLVFPGIGVFHEQVSQTETYPRMGGLGHPNELGFFSASTVVLFCALHYRKRLSLLTAGPAVLLGMMTLVSCFSRTSFLLTAIGLLVVYRKEIFKEWFMLWALVALLLLIPVVGYVYATGELDWIIAESMTKLSKSGSSDELTTGTGRTRIWSYAIKMIGEKPMFGHGYATQRFVMEEHSYHCHNSFLNYCMSAGVLTGILFLAIVAHLLHAMWVRPRPEIDGLLILVLVGGLAEGVLISPVPNAVMLFFVAALFWRQMKMDTTPLSSPSF